MAYAMAVGRNVAANEQGQPRTRGKRSRKVTALLWTIQGFLALTFLLTGAMKLTMPLEVLIAQMPIALPGLFVRFLGLSELLGAIGLVLPCLLNIRPGFTPLAASGLVVIMSGATVYTVIGGGGATALMPLVIGILAGLVAYKRLRPARDA